MLNPKLKLNEDIFRDTTVLKSPRDGFGESVYNVAKENSNVIVLGADLSHSLKLDSVIDKLPKQFVQCGIAEQNTTGIAAGLAISGKIPFIATHSVFGTIRNWDQIRLSVCLSNLNVKICGSHEGFSNGPDGANAEPLEDIATMRVLPNMVVINPIDYEQTKKAVVEISKHKGPTYLRFSKADLPQITTKDTPFKIGKAEVLVEGNDVTLVSCGGITYEALIAVKNLKAKYKIETEMIASPTIKPLDEETILKSAKKTGLVVTIEEHQINGGLGGAVAELLSEKLPTPMLRIGVSDSFGESGNYKDLLDKYGLSSHHIENKIINLIKEKKGK